MSENQQVILNFIQACNEHDIEKALAFIDAECFYHNIPIEPVTGIKAITGVLDPMFAVSSKVDWNVHNIAETTTYNVLTERTDRFFSGSRRPGRGPGLGEVVGGARSCNRRPCQGHATIETNIL